MQKKGKAIREKIIEADIPKEIEEEIAKSYKDLSNAYKMEEADTAVRSSATAEDLPGASFAGEHETYLNVVGQKNVLKQLKWPWLLFGMTAPFLIALIKVLIILKLLFLLVSKKWFGSDKGSSGVMFTIDTESGFRDVVEIDASWGLGKWLCRAKLHPMLI